MALSNAERQARHRERKKGSASTGIGSFVREEWAKELARLIADAGGSPDAMGDPPAMSDDEAKAWIRSRIEEAVIGQLTDKRRARKGACESQTKAEIRPARAPLADEQDARTRQEIVTSLYDAVRHAVQGAEMIPAFVRESCEKKVWEHDRVFAGGSRQPPTSFHEFVHAPYPVGIRSTFDQVRSYLGNDAAAQQLWDECAPAKPNVEVLQLPTPEEALRVPMLSID